MHPPPKNSNDQEAFQSAVEPSGRLARSHYDEDGRPAHRGDDHGRAGSKQQFEKSSPEMAANKQSQRFQKVGDLSAVSEESKQFLSSTQDHIIANSSQEPSSDIVIAPLRVDLDQVLDANVINTEEQELNCNEEMKHLKTKTPSEESDDDYQLTVPYIRSPGSSSA